jgi:hypothetical protein
MITFSPFLAPPRRTEDAQPLRFFFEGPYGSPSVDVNGALHQMLLLFAGGIGTDAVHVQQPDELLLLAC